MSISVVIMLQIAFQYKLFAWTLVLLTTYYTTVETNNTIKKHTHIKMTSQQTLTFSVENTVL